jgi:DNA modification methylase
MPIEAKWDHSYTKDCIPNFSTNMGLPRHRWYEFKEGYGNTLVERAINETKLDLHKTELTVIDPFSGSGTTPLTALQNGCNAIALEVNPFMNFVGKTKCRKKSVNKDKLIDELDWIMQHTPFEIESPLELQSSFSPDGGKDKWLFNKSVLRGFEALYQIINKCENSDIFLLSLFASTMQCCNAKKDGKCLRYKKNWDTLALSSRELRELFLYNSNNIINDIEISPLINGDRIFYEGDSRSSIIQVEDKLSDLVVFSPPYLNSFDYSDIYRPELFLGKYVSNNEELRFIRKKTLRSHVQYRWENKDKSKSEWAKNIAHDVYENRELLWNREIPDMINNYFYDMEQILHQSYRVSKRGAQLWFVVGTSSYAGVEIPVDLILADIASKQGWTLLNVNALRKLRTSSQCASDKNKKIRLRESLIICKKE